MVLVEHQACILLVILLVNFISVSTRPAYEARITMNGVPIQSFSPYSDSFKFIVNSNPDRLMRPFSSGQIVSAYIIDANGNRIDQYPSQGQNLVQYGYSNGGGNVVWTNTGANEVQSNQGQENQYGYSNGGGNVVWIDTGANEVQSNQGQENQYGYSNGGEKVVWINTGNNEVQSNQGQENQDQSGYSNGGANVVWTNSGNNEVQSNDNKNDTTEPIYSYGTITENPVTSVVTVDNTGHSETNGGPVHVPAHNGGIITIPPLILSGTIGQREQKIKEYLAELLNNQSPQPLKVVTSQHNSHVTTEKDSEEIIAVTKTPDLQSQENFTTESSQNLNSQLPIEPIQDITDEQNKPAPMDQQPNTLLLTDPFEESNEQEQEDVEDSSESEEHQFYNIDLRNLPFEDSSTESVKTNNFKIFDRSLGAHLASYNNSKTMSNVARGRSKNHKGTIPDEAISVLSNSKMTSGNLGMDQTHSISISSYNETIQNSSLVKRLNESDTKSNDTDSNHEDIFSALPFLLTKTDVIRSLPEQTKSSVMNEKRTGRIPIRNYNERSVFKIPASRNVAAQNEIISNVLSLVLQNAMNPTTSHSRTKREIAQPNEYHSKKFRGNGLDSMDSYAEMRNEDFEKQM